MSVSYSQGEEGRKRKKRNRRKRRNASMRTSFFRLRCKRSPNGQKASLFRSRNRSGISFRAFKIHGDAGDALLIVAARALVVFHATAPLRVCVKASRRDMKRQQNEKSSSLPSLESPSRGTSFRCKNAESRPGLRRGTRRGCSACCCRL